MSNESLYESAVKGVRWLVLSRAVVQAFTWVFTLVVIRILRPTDYGLIAMAGLVTTLANMLLDGGLSAALVQRKCDSPEVYKAAKLLFILGSSAAMLIVDAAAGPIAEVFKAPLLVPVLRIYAFQFLLSALMVVPQSVLMVRRQFGTLAIIQSVSGISTGIATLVLAATGAGVWSLVIGVLVGNAVRLIVIESCSHAPKGLSTRFSLLRPYVAFSSYLVGQRLLWFWAEQADLFIVAKLLGADVLGTYSVARNLAQIPLDKTGGIVNQVSLPSFAAVQGDIGRWLAGYTKFIRLVSAIAFPLFWGMAAVAPVGLPVILGGKWAAATLPFSLLCFMLPLRAVHSLSSTALLGLGRSDVSFRVVAIWAACLTPLFFIGAHYGLVGIASAWVAGFVLVYFCYTLIVARALRIHTRLLLSPMCIPAGAGAVCAAGAALVGWLSTGQLRPGAVLCVQILVGTFGWALTLRLSSSSLYEEILQTLRQLIPRRATI